MKNSPNNSTPIAAGERVYVRAGTYDASGRPVPSLATGSLSLVENGMASVRLDGRRKDIVVPAQDLRRLTAEVAARLAEVAR